MRAEFHNQPPGSNTQPPPNLLKPSLGLSVRVAPVDLARISVNSLRMIGSIRLSLVLLQFQRILNSLTNVCECEGYRARERAHTRTTFLCAAASRGARFLGAR